MTNNDTNKTAQFFLTANSKVSDVIIVLQSIYAFRSCPYMRSPAWTVNYCWNIRIPYHGMANSSCKTSASIIYRTHMAWSRLSANHVMIINIVFANRFNCLTSCTWWVAERYFEQYYAQVLQLPTIPHLNFSSRIYTLPPPVAPNCCIVHSPCGHQRARIPTYILYLILPMQHWSSLVSA